MPTESGVRRAGFVALAACGLLALTIVAAIADPTGTYAIPFEVAFGVALVGVAWYLYPSLAAVEPLAALAALIVCVVAGVVRLLFGLLDALELDGLDAPGLIALLVLSAAWFGTIGVIAERGDLWPRDISLYAQTAAVGYILGAVGVASGRLSMAGLPSPVLGVFGIVFLARFGLIASRGKLPIRAGAG